MRIEYKTGGQRTVRQSIGRRLVRVGIAREAVDEKSGSYMTRDMRARTSAPAGIPAVDADADGVDRKVAGAGPVDLSADDGLDGLDAEELHALAKDRGVKVHHASGADKVRAALRGAAQ